MKGRYLVDDIVKIMINLNSGESTGTAWGCDLSKKYVEINSEYTTWYKIHCATVDLKDSWMLIPIIYH